MASGYLHTSRQMAGKSRLIISKGVVDVGGGTFRGNILAMQE